MNVTRYNAKDCAVTVDGVFITQLGEDMVTGEKDEALFEPVVGAQGDVIKSEINNPLGTITIVVQPTSPQKQFLFALQNRTDEFPLWIVNKSLGERFGGAKAALKEFPEMARGATAEDMSFVFAVFDYTVESAE